MLYGYDPYQKGTNMGGLLGGVGGDILSFLAILGKEGKGPLAGLLGPKKEQMPMGPEQVPQARGQGPMGGIPQGPPQMQSSPFPQQQPPMPPNPALAQGTQGGMGGPGGMDPQMMQQIMQWIMQSGMMGRMGG